MPEVHLLREDSSEIRFTHRPMGGVFFAVIGAAIAWVAWVKGGDSTGRWIGALAGGFFSLVGVGAAFWRYELVFDLLQRRYTRRKGFWPSPKEESGPFDDIEAVTLSIEQRRTSSKSSSTSAVWVVGVKLRPDAKPIKVAEEMAEESGYARFESLAKTLRVNASDGTTGIASVIPWDRLDETLAARSLSGKPERDVTAGIAPLPPASAIEFSNVPGARVIRLPAAGFSAGGLLLGVFGFVFFFAGAAFAWAKASGMTVRESQPGAIWIITPVFAGIGLLVMALAWFAMYSRDVVREESSALVFSFEAFGRSWLPQRIEKREIEEVALRDPTRMSGGPSVRVGGVSLGGRPRAPRQEILVRSDRRVKRIGSDLSDEEREWLRDTILVMTAG